MSTLHSSLPTSAGRKASGKKLLRIAPLAGLAAAGINASLYLLGTALGTMDPTVQVGPDQSITLLPVMLSSFVPALVAGLVLAGLNLFLARPFRVFNILALVILLVSFTNPYLMIENVPPLMGLWLNLMHVVVAGVVVYSFNRWAVKD